MGRTNTSEEHLQTLRWAKSLPIETRKCDNLELSSLRSMFQEDLTKYFALCALSRSKSAPKQYQAKALKHVFNVRVKLEKSILQSVNKVVLDDPSAINQLFGGNFYGASKKQGVSVRFPLSACQPSQLCGASCYAHDVLDAAPASVIRGAVNGFLAESYENDLHDFRDLIIKKLAPHTRKAIKESLNDLRNTPPGFSRRAHIRFAHVGEIARYPAFGNRVARQVDDLSNGEVDCVAYTRHPDAEKLDPSLWIINFTLDKASKDRRAWAPSNARIVFSAWDGELSEDAEINFLEHHRWSHSEPIGGGNICPVTLPNTVNRTCDAVQCCKCFKRP